MSVPKGYEASSGISRLSRSLLTHGDSLIAASVDCFTAMITVCLHVTFNVQNYAGGVCLS